MLQILVYAELKAKLYVPLLHFHPPVLRRMILRRPYTVYIKTLGKSQQIRAFLSENIKRQVSVLPNSACHQIHKNFPLEVFADLVLRLQYSLPDTPYYRMCPDTQSPLPGVKSSACIGCMEFISFHISNLTPLSLVKDTLPSSAWI